MIGCESVRQIKLQNISKQKFSCNRASLGYRFCVPYRFNSSKGQPPGSVWFGLNLVRIEFS